MRRHSSAQWRHACAQAWQCACGCRAHSAPHAWHTSAHKRQRSIAYLLSRDYLEAMVETMEILANPDARKAIADHRAGRTKFVPLSALDADE